MKKLLNLLCLIVLAVTCGCASNQSAAAPPEPAKAIEPAKTAATNLQEDSTMKITVTDGTNTISYELNSSPAARELYAQLPLTLPVENFSSNEKIFYPPQKLTTNQTPLSSGETGSLSYYKPWGNVVMFYAPCQPNGSLFALGKTTDASAKISQLSGTITISKAD